MRRFAVAVAVLFAVSASAIDNPPPFPKGRGVKELRLAVVCYGGVSLAIYMYGNVRELHHLALASSALECDVAQNRKFCGDAVKMGEAWRDLPPSARPYYDELIRLWDADEKEARTRVVIDIISGTSAGGINGVFLAKALTHNRSIEGLRQLWFEQADIGELAGGYPWWAFALGRVFRGKAALGGDGWLDELYRALAWMDAPQFAGKPAMPSLLWLGQPIDLLVTSTDFYGTERLIEVGDPPVVSELRYDQVYRFSARRDGQGFVRDSHFDDRNDNVALAFAGRSSASFPVAFPAIPVKQLTDVLKTTDAENAALADRFFRDRIIDLQGATSKDFAERLYLVDGGVLNNYPFSIAYRRVNRRSPRFETERRFLYLEPDPRAPRTIAQFKSQSDPNVLAMAFRSKTSIPGAQPIADDLLQIREHNQRVKRIAKIIQLDEQRAQDEWDAERTNATAITARVEQSTQSETETSVAEKVERKMGTLDPKLLPSAQPRTKIQTMRDDIEKDAGGRFPLAEEAYSRLRVASVLDQFSRVLGRAVCNHGEEYDGPRAALMREIVMQWARKQPFMVGDDEEEEDRAKFLNETKEERTKRLNAAKEARAKFLNAFDLGHLRRKLRFVDDWLNAQYAPKDGEIDYKLSREQLEAAQVVIAGHVDQLSRCMSGACLKDKIPSEIQAVERVICVPVDGTPAEQAGRILSNEQSLAAIKALATAAETELLNHQEALLGQLYKDFIRETKGWPDNGSARAVLARYLGFPYWDRVAYPYTAFSGVGDLAQIDINRMSPTDATVLSKNGAGKLVGAGLAHFKAFLDADGRQTDYLWGRFDGAERLLWMLGIRNDPNRVLPLLRAIMKEEKDDAVMSPKNLQKMEKCLATPFSC